MNDDTICDSCGSEVPLAEANTGDFGDWDGATLCNECYAHLRFEFERPARHIVKDTTASIPPRHATIIALDAAAQAMRVMPWSERVGWVLYLLERVNDDSAEYETFLGGVANAVNTRIKRGRW